MMNSGGWHSWLAHLVYTQGVTGSNPVPPTRCPRTNLWPRYCDIAGERIRRCTPYDRDMKRSALAAGVVAALVLTGCSGASGDNDAACDAYLDVLSSWATQGSSSATAAAGVAIQLRNDVAPLAESELSEAILKMADVFDDPALIDNPPQWATDASTTVRDTCEALGYNFG